MTDRELLELAAKAAGIEVWFPRMSGGRAPDGTRIILTPCHTHGADGDVTEWNPLTDDGDALRLAVKLGIQHSNETNSNRTWAGVLGKTEMHIEEYTEDPYAATRRAIVRAAAEIGRSMK